jgi:hypothetical protein
MTKRITGTKNVTPNGDQTISAPYGNINLYTTSTGVVTLGSPGSLPYNSSGGLSVNNESNVGNPNGSPYDPGNIYDTPEDRQQGAAYFAGGVGIEKDLNVGGFIYGRVALSNTSTQQIVTATNLDSYYYPVFTDYVGQNGSFLYADNQSTSASKGLRYNPATGQLAVDQVFVSSTSTSTSPVTGAFTVTGGVGILGDVYIGGSEYVDTLYTKFITSQQGPVTISPQSQLTDIVGDIRVQGTNPIGTAPVVTNVLYVTMDGDDTNDGRAQDASRACRTISGATKSPYFQPGTQIVVSAGRYLENNPILLKPYTSVKGSDIRTTFIEPINKTQDLFHLQSGCYLNYMTFLNGRSGLLDGPYDNGYNRGAYATAFPPQSGDNRIDLFHSPYVQNCTNQSGPWLKDGTMFVPDQTVQIPTAVGMGSWEANTTTIQVSVVNGGTLSIGQSINSGQQNQGFFDARTLLLANKPFLQEQVVAYVSSTYPTFTYNQQLCYRDTGILLENMAYDMAFGGNQKSVESGLAYYRGVTSVIAGQEEETISAIEYLSSLCQQIIVNSTCTVLTAPVGIPTANQVINTVLTDGAIATDSIQNLFSITTNIIQNGPDAAPEVYTSTGPDAAFVSAEILMQANRAFIQEEVINYINYSLVQPQSPTYLPYNQIKCRRDVSLIVDSIGLDLLFPTAGFSQSNYSGLQYWNSGNYTSPIATQLTATVQAMTYLRDLSIKIVTNVTTATDALVGVYRYSNGVQTTASNYATAVETANIASNFNIILSILKGNTAGWTDKIIMSGPASDFPSTQNTYSLLQANKTYLADEVVAYIDATNPGLVNTTGTYYGNVIDIVDSICFDLLYGGNRQSIQGGFSYYGFNGNTAIPNESTATVAAFGFLGNLASNVVQGVVGIPQQTKVQQITSLPLGDQVSADMLVQATSTITNIIANGASAAGPLMPISLVQDTSTSTVNAFNLLEANKPFIIEEVIAYINNSYNNSAFQYDQAKCYRDTGLIVDAVSQDILLGGNAKSLEAGLSYWNQGYNYVGNQITTTTMAINFARDLALQIIANTPVTPQTGTVATQVINTFFENGGAYMPTQAVSRNFNMITNIIASGPGVAPPLYNGGGLFSLTGLNGSQVNIAPTVTSLTQIDTNTYLVGLSERTIGFGVNSTLYFGDTHVFPLTDVQVETKSLEYTSSSTTWNSRKLDPIGSMGGSLVDGGVISDRSPIQSFVYDAYTQVNQGGVGVKVTNNGYAQLVSVFTIFCSIAVEVDNGGIASITNSNCNFGDLGLVSKGYGSRSFSGTVFNPAFRAYPFSPSTSADYLDQYYPSGYWPNNGNVEIFLSDTADRPHIGQVMEVVPPEDHLNEQGFLGFLNAQPNTGTLVTGSIVLENIANTDVAIGNTLYIRDQYGYEYDNFQYKVDNFGNYVDGTGAVLADQSLSNVQVNGVINPNYGKWYAGTGTVVTDVGYKYITLNQALQNGGGDPTNPNFFTLYFCGNSYYSVLTSDTATPPYRVGHSLLEANNNSHYQGPVTDQISAHVASIRYLKDLVDQVISNTTIAVSPGNDQTQTISPAVSGGSGAQAFIDLRFGYIADIIGATTATYNTIVPQSAVTKTGTIPAGAGSAITLINNNLDFLAAEINAHLHDDPGVSDIFTGLTADQISYIETKCARDVKIILQRIIYDLETGGNYNSVYAGLSYWGREGTHHIVGLGEAVNRTDLFPDGATVNFYQRSYISASGYLFEYVGAGTNYGSLPQRGVKDPQQSKETIQLNSGKVFFTSTDQNGDFRIGPGLVISQATGVLSGRTFTQSLFANMTPFILAIEG